MMEMNNHPVPIKLLQAKVLAIVSMIVEQKKHTPSSKEY